MFDRGRWVKRVAGMEPERRLSEFVFASAADDSERAAMVCFPCSAQPYPSDRGNARQHIPHGTCATPLRTSHHYASVHLEFRVPPMISCLLKGHSSCSLIPHF